MRIGPLTALIAVSILSSPVAAYASATLAITSINGVAVGTAYVSQDAPTLFIMGQSVDPLAGIITFSATDGVVVQTATSTPLDDGLFSLSIDASVFADGPLSLEVIDENGGSHTNAQAGIEVVKDTAAPTVTDVRIASNNVARTSSARAGDIITLSFTANEELDIVDIVINGTGVSETTSSIAAPYAYTAEYVTPTDATEGLVSFSLSYTDATGSGDTVNVTDDGSSVLIDYSAPVITLNGAAALELEVGNSYSEQGAVATDASGVEGDVAISGSVDTETLGSYTLTYTALDVLGYTSTTTRLVTVIARVSGGGGGGGGGSSRRTQVVDELEESAGPEIAPASIAPEGEVLGATAYNFTRYLKRGDTGADVTELQTLLGTLGYFAGTPTGYFGPVTAAALMTYQASLGLEPVGFVGPKTLAFLNQGTLAEDVRVAVLIQEIERLKAAIALLGSVQ